MKLSIIIVSYNTRDFLKKCLDSLKKINFSDFEIIIVDNASKDGTIEYLESLSEKNLTFIKNPKNLGFSKANNRGIKIARGDYLLFLNPDTEVMPDTLAEIVKFMEKDSKIGALTCKVVLPNGKLDDSCHRGFPTPWNALCFFSGLEELFPKSRIFAGYHMGWKDYNKPHEIDAGAGSFLMLRRKAGEDINWWDEDYFFYGEDLDLCYRLKQKGWKVYYFPKVSIIHYKGIASGIKKVSRHLSLADIETRRSSTTARYDAMKIFYNKYYNKRYPWIINWLVSKAINMKLAVSLKRV